MRRMRPIIGSLAVLVQLLRFWPLNLTDILTAFVTGGVFYIACKVGWDIQKYQINQVGYKGWGHWFSRAVTGTAIFLVISLTLLFISFHNPICEETKDSLYGRCEQYSSNSSDPEKPLPFKPTDKALYPFFLALAYYIGSATKRFEYRQKDEKTALNHSST